MKKIMTILSVALLAFTACTQQNESQQGAERVIELLDEESGELRDALRMQQHRYRRRVNKDW